MATATNTTLGEIRLAGDLAGSNNGLAPALTNTGVTPGSYSLPSLTVDAKGRITSIASTPLSSVIPTATTSSLGLVKPDNTTITIDGTGTLTSILPPATSSTLGVVRANDGSISITAGVISAVTATSSNRGIVRPDNTTTTVDGTGIISAVFPVATAGAPGIVRPDGTTIVMGAGTGVLTATGSVAIATNSTVGAVRPDGTTITVDASGVISSAASAVTATSSTLGVVRPDNTTMTVSSGVLSSTFPDATSSTLGKARPDNTTMTVSSGVLTATGQTATNSTLGVVRPDGTTITVNGSGVLSAVYPAATNSTLGAVRPDGTTVTISSGVLSAVGSPAATTSTLGRVIVGSNINVDASGVISVPFATSSILGVARGDGTTITGNSVLSVAPSITAAATASTLGRVIVGSNISVAGDGTISVPTATNSTLGVARVDNTSLVSSSGIISTSNNIPKLDTQNTWTKAQTFIPFGGSLTAGTTTALIGDESNFYSYTISPTADSTNTIFTMSTPVAGRKYTFVLNLEYTGVSVSLSGDTATIFGKSVTLSSYGYYILEFVVATKPDNSVVVVNTNSLWFTSL